MIFFPFSKSESITTNWTGGKTTQLAIYPFDSNYQSRNFFFRLSTATVEVYESSFTHLPDINRELMILEGRFEIVHENQYAKTLQKFDVDSFSGNWKTKGFGKVTDFNLMLNKNAEGELMPIILKKSEAISISTKDYSFLGLYILSGMIQLPKNPVATKHDFILIELESNDETIEITTHEDCELVFSKIKIL